MDFADPVQRRTFFAVHEGLPRQGPGSRQFTEQAFAQTSLPANAEILDVGCGPGMQTFDLARVAPAARICAVDLFIPFLQELRDRASVEAGSAQIHPVCANMAQLPFNTTSFDLIWSEGAAYTIGVSQALQLWRPLLRRQGYLVFSNAGWLTTDPPDEIQRWWAAHYSDMRDRAGALQQITEAGYTCRADFVLPPSAWWEHYYTPMQQRLDTLAHGDHGQDLHAGVLAEIQTEIDMYTAYSEHYSYRFFVLQLRGEERDDSDS
ncbi:MAG: class I SAM-dependent methyltransferase [Pseudomonadota bacterium]